MGTGRRSAPGWTPSQAVVGRQFSRNTALGLAVGPACGMSLMAAAAREARADTASHAVVQAQHVVCLIPAVCCFVLQVCFTAVREVLAKSGVTPRQVGCVIVNCSLFNPTPSLSALIMNHFKMPSNTINYNLGGMGCSGMHCT